MSNEGSYSTWLALRKARVPDRDGVRRRSSNLVRPSQPYEDLITSANYKVFFTNLNHRQTIIHLSLSLTVRTYNRNTNRFKRQLTSFQWPEASSHANGQRQSVRFNHLTHLADRFKIRGRIPYSYPATNLHVNDKNSETDVAFPSILYDYRSFFVP